MVGQAIDFDSRLFVDGMEVGDNFGAACGAGVGQRLQNFLTLYADAQFGEIGGHADFLEVSYGLFYTGLGPFFFRPFGNAPDFGGKFCKTGNIIAIDVICLGTPDGGQAGTVGHIKASGEFMAQLVAGKVLTAAQFRKTAVGDSTGVHDFAHGIIVRLVFEGAAGSINHGQHQGFGNPVGQ